MSLAVSGALLAGEKVGLRAEEGVIVELGPDVHPRPEDDVLDAAGAILVPPLINGHTHAAMTLFRGHGDDLPLMRWLREKIWPVERQLEPEDVYWGTRLACLEMARSGTTRFWDMYWHPQAAARAVRDAGIRATVAAPLIDVQGGSEALREAALVSLDELAQSQSGASDRIDVGLAPHAIYTVTEESLRWIAELAAERGLPVQIHLSETEQEVTDCLAAHGIRPAHYLDRVGLLSPRTVLAHGTWLDDSELELIAARGAIVVTNPVANLKLAVGRVFPYPQRTGGGRPGGAGHRRPRLEQLARPVRRHEGARAAPEARGPGSRRDQCRGDVGDRDRPPGAAARRGPRPRRSVNPPTSCSCAPTRPSSALASCPPRSSTRRPEASCRARWWQGG